MGVMVGGKGLIEVWRREERVNDVYPYRHCVGIYCWDKEISSDTSWICLRK